MSDTIHSEGDIELELSQAAIPHATIAISEVDDDQQDDSTTPLTAGTQEGNQDTNEGGQGEQPQEGDDIRDDAIGMEAQTLLNIQNEISRPTSVMGFWRMGGNLIVILYLIPITVALLTVTIVDWDSQCNRPLKHWTISQIIIQVLLTLNHAVILYKLPSSADTAEVVNERIRALAPYYLLKRILNLLWFSWFIVGMVWTFQALQEDTCPSSAPYLFRMCFALVVIQIFLTSLAVLFCCCSCLVLFLRVIANPIDLQGTAPRGASDTLIRALPVKRYRAGQTVKKEDSTCAICLSDYEEGEAIRFLPCNHHYHRNCVDKWLIINKACPFCKRNIDEQSNPPSSTTAATPETTTTTTTATTNEDTNLSDSPSPSPTAAILNGDQENIV